ncbi:MAG: nitroreductase family protein [Anaerolineae bacterium]|nr:nitroreductase family protein [Anaerolineae bacterium]
MITNPIIESMLNRKSVRKYTDQQPTDEVIETVVRAGQQAPFAAQLCSVLLTRKKAPFGAPLWFTLCVDMHRMELIMAKRGWTVVANDLSLLLLAIQDVALMAENMIIAAESLGMGSCFLGTTPYRAEHIQKKYHLPKRVFPLVELVMGYPDEEFPPRPRYPLAFALFEDRYPELTDAMVEEAMRVMDEGYLTQGYYRKQRAKIKLESEREETFTYDDYSWTEHISRKWGQWMDDPQELLEQLEKCGFVIKTEA